MILRISAVAALLAAADRPASSSAFQCRRFRPIARAGARASHRHRSPPRMSSIPDDDDGDSKNLIADRAKKLSLPPAPEDGIALGGDVLALFVYSYLDHATNALYADTAAKVDNVADLVAASADAASDGGAASLPVWFDPADLAAHGREWLARGTAEAPYAPAIANPGLAFVALAASWILCGWLSGAFLTSNTLECAPSRAMTVTLKTWAGTCLLMVMLALGSDALWGALDGINALSAPARGGLTKADADFIFDSLTVLAFWRFMFNWLLGYRK